MTLGGLTRRREFLFVAKGVRAARPGIVVQARTRGDAKPLVRFGYTASKKVGNAVTRNRCKRRLRAAVHDLALEHALAGVDYVLIARQHTPDLEWDRLLDDVKSALITVRKQLTRTRAADARP